ncbi:Tyrosine recombinase XerA [uncultured archaeon]|nr:Tyrosine recombinase XerA [uncultured archaeon]
MRQPLVTLATWYYTDCEARNLQPKTILFYHQKLVYLLDAFGDSTPEDLTVHNLRALAVTLRQTREWSAQQTNHFITVVKQFFNYLLAEDLAEVNPSAKLKKIKMEERLPTILTQADVQRILEVIPSNFTGLRNRTMILTLLDTGLRLNELLCLTVPDVDFAHLQLRVQGKGRREALVPFSLALTRVLSKYLPQRDKYALTEALWVSRQGEAVTTDYVTHMLCKYGNDASIPHLHAHLFRHTFATEFLRNGGNPQMLQRILRHTTPVVTQRYIHLTDTDTSVAHKTASPLEKWQLAGRGGRKKKSA